jgi:hypothetical protein
VLKKSHNLVANYKTTKYQIGLKPGPSGIFLMVDKDNNTPTRPDGQTNFPNDGDNHGKDGSNMNFSDGHAEYITTKKWNATWNRSQDSNFDETK